MSDRGNSVSRPRNDASATIAGFVFQVHLTILQWLRLAPDEYLELEAGEDIDVVRLEADDSGDEAERLLMQLKHLSGRSLTLKSRESLEAIANFCCHRSAYPDWRLLTDWEGARLDCDRIRDSHLGRHQAGQTKAR